MRLSICIPTYHGRCGTLREALDSIVPQITPKMYGQVEVCISDNDALTMLLAHNWLRYRVETMRDLSLAWAALLRRDSVLSRSLMARVHAEQWNGRSLLALKIHTWCRPADEWALLIGYTRHLYLLPEYCLGTFPIALLPSPLLRLGYRINLACSRKGRADNGRAMRGHV